MQQNQIKYYKISEIHHQCISNDAILADIYFLSHHKENINPALCYLVLFNPTDECVFAPNLIIARKILENAWALLHLDVQNS